MSNYTAPEKKSEKLRDVNFQNETESAKNQKAETPFDIITQNANIKFFKSQNAEYYINIDARDFGICGNPIIKSNAFDVMISLLLNKITENIWEEKEINKIKRNCSALATINAEFFGLDNRLGFKNNRIFYDLCNKKHEVISISDNEISTIKKYDTTIMFAINENAKEQISPNLQSGKNKYLELLKRHFKLKNEDDLLLLAIYIIACFIPHIPHPVLNLYGTQGSSK
ncbi:MAG: hypothetical protein FWH10_09135, partial [Oscillospiraceae bacterium]|nr:hypothetical protein [Oscillospiraceae bacterium]